MNNSNEVWIEMNQKTEEEIRRGLAQGIYGARKIPIAQEVLRKKSEERQDKMLTDSFENQKQATNASKISAGAAAISALCALLAFLLKK